MIYTAENNSVFSIQERSQSGGVNLKDGDIVSAKILSLKDGGNARIFFNGTVFDGTVSGNLKEGNILRMRVVIKSAQGGGADRIFLIPEPENISEKFQPYNTFSLFSKLGLPKNELSSAILSFLTASEHRLDDDTAVRLFRFLKNTKKDVKKAAFVAGLLENKGIEPDDNVFKKVYAALFGNENRREPDKNGHKPDDDEDVLKLLNHMQSGALHWLVFPFKRNIGEKTVDGSLALLLDLQLKVGRLTVMRCKFENEEWIFILKDNRFSFECESRAITEKEKNSLQTLFSQCLVESGLTGISVAYGITEDWDFDGVNIVV